MLTHNGKLTLPAAAGVGGPGGRLLITACLRLGVEMQHDTSPHTVEVGGRKYKAQTASAVLCYSRMLFFQINPTFQRFDCKVFLADALRYTGQTALYVAALKQKSRKVVALALHRGQERLARIFPQQPQQLPFKF